MSSHRRPRAVYGPAVREKADWPGWDDVELTAGLSLSAPISDEESFACLNPSDPIPDPTSW